MEIGELVDPALPRSLPYRIYLPPCYQEIPSGELPALYALHGLQRTDSQWDDLGADEVAGQLIGSGAAPPYLIVMPWERLGLDFEDTIVSYLIPFVERTYGASAQPEHRAIGGISRGAGWALRIGLKHPELFAAIGLHSPAVLPPDMYELPRWMDAAPESPLPDLWIDIGERDTLRFSAIELTELLDDLGVSYHWEMLPGEHIASYWESNMERYMLWYVSEWEDGMGRDP